MIVGVPTPTAVAPIVYLERGVSDRATARGSTSTTGGEMLSDICFERTVYRCPSPVRLHYLFSGQGWNCWARELGRICGQGTSPKLAREDWHQRFHAEFQRLYAMRPFEMRDGEAREWQTMLSLVDVLDYRQSQPLSVREIGCIRYGRNPFPSRIHWIDGRRENFLLNQAPADLAGFRPGQWVEAIVERDATSGRLLQIVHAQKIPSPLPESPSLVKKGWYEMPEADLPEADWDWPNDEEE